MVAPSGIEPELFALRGRRVNRLHHGASLLECVAGKAVLTGLSKYTRESAACLYRRAAVLARARVHQRQAARDSELALFGSQLAPAHVEGVDCLLRLGGSGECRGKSTRISRNGRIFGQVVFG